MLLIGVTEGKTTAVVEPGGVFCGEPEPLASLSPAAGVSFVVDVFEAACTCSFDIEAEIARDAGLETSAVKAVLVFGCVACAGPAFASLARVASGLADAACAGSDCAGSGCSGNACPGSTGDSASVIGALGSAMAVGTGAVAAPAVLSSLDFFFCGVPAVVCAWPPLLLSFPFSNAGRFW